MYIDDGGSLTTDGAVAYINNFAVRFASVTWCLGIHACRTANSVSHEIPVLYYLGETTAVGRSRYSRCFLEQVEDCSKCSSLK